MDTPINNTVDADRDRLKEFSIVGIVASPVRRDALIAFLRHTDEIRGLAFVVALQDNEQMEPISLTLLAASSTKSFFVAEGDMDILPDSVYILPPRQHIRFRSWNISVEPYACEQEGPLPADRFMMSLVEGFGGNTICVLLSRDGMDGEVGIQAISRAGGLIIVDETGMTNSMRQGGSLGVDWNDYVLALEEMPTYLLDYMTFHTNQTREVIAEELRTLFSTLKQASGLDFGLYKQSGVMRRLQRRMELAQLESLKAYNRYLCHHPEEVLALQRDLLNGITLFFREPDSFKHVYDTVIPAIFSKNDSGKQIRIWAAGCSTGEEAYSLAILVYRHMETLEDVYDVKIFATDANEDAVAFAGDGVYPESIAENMPAMNWQAYFTHRDHAYHIKEEIREMVIVGRHNLLQDPPFGRLDLISCRNVLIYLQPYVQHRLIEKFHHVLKPGGYLFLGSSERVGKTSELFEQPNPAWTIYQPIGGTVPPDKWQVPMPKTNEELIVFNEELLSAHEELQSGNEELQAMNREHRHKIRELEQLCAGISDKASAELLAAVGLLAAGVAQDIRNPLTALMGFLKLIVTDTTEPRYIDVMAAELEQIKTVTDELLVLARPQDQHYRQADIPHLLNEAIAGLRAEAELKGVDILTSIADPIPRIRCIPEQIKLVFANILTNGMEAMPEGGKLLVEAKTEQDLSVIVSFHDTGSGMLEYDVAKLGKRFFTTKKDGLGLGLLISYKIMENHLGHIAVTSEPAKGTLVEITLR